MTKLQTQIGAAVIVGEQIISVGYNGMPSQRPNDFCEVSDADRALLNKPNALHAEANVFMKKL